MEEIELNRGRIPEGLLNGRFRVHEKIGEGGFAVTYRGRDEHEGNECVIKELSLKRVEDWKTIELFQREARVLKQLNHPRIPRFIDFFTVQGEGETHVYLVQEFIRGPNLEDLIREGKHFTEKEVVKIALGITNILEYLHGFAPPIIHRDIKPSNIILSPDGEPYLVDFGAVRDKILHTQRTEAGNFTVIGTYGYMPFEQFQGRAVPATDLYSLGATMIAVLSHKEPHEMDHLGSRLEFEHHVQVSRDLEKVLRKMTEPMAENRYSTAAELKADLEAILSDQPVRAARTPGSSKRMVALAIAVLAILVGVFTALLTARLNTAKPPETTVIKEPEVRKEQGPVSGYQIRGKLLFDGKSVSELNPPMPRFWFRNEQTGKAYGGSADYKDGSFVVAGLPEGEFGVSIQFDLNPQNPLSYPGDLRSWTTFTVQKEGNPELTVEMQKIIRMVKPQDTEHPLAGWGAELQDRMAFEGPLELEWESLGDDVFYDYKVSRIESPYTFKDTVAGGTTPKTKITLPLDPSKDNEYYLLTLYARKNGHSIGMLMTHGANGYGWDYRFRIKR